MAVGPRDAAFTHAEFQNKIVAAQREGNLKEARELRRLASFNADANPQTNQIQPPAPPVNLPNNSTTVIRKTKGSTTTADTHNQKKKVGRSKGLSTDGSTAAAKKNYKKVSKEHGVAQVDGTEHGESSIESRSGDVTTSSRLQIPTAGEVIETLAHKLGPAAERFPHLPVGPGYRPARYDYKGKGTWDVARAD